jgi:hypothetical protein
MFPLALCPCEPFDVDDKVGAGEAAEPLGKVDGGAGTREGSPLAIEVDPESDGKNDEVSGWEAPSVVCDGNELEVDAELIVAVCIW